MKKTIFITGTSSGIGKETAKFFQSKGWNVAATMRTPEKEKELNLLPGIKLYMLDVLDKKSICKAIKDAEKDLGPIDVIVNNAGYAAVGAFETADPEQVKKQFETNVFGLMNVTREILPYFRKRKSGVIINISSIGGHMSFPLYSLYHGTKWAVEGFSESLQYELRPFNIRVKLIEPGAIKTDFYSRSQVFFEIKGLDDYNDYVSRTINKIIKIGENAKGPAIIAKKIFEAANDNSFRLRYSAGGGAPFILFLRRIIPDSLFFRIVRSSVGQ